MTAKVDIFNKALRNVQSKNSVRSVDERSQEAVECAKAYEGAIRETLARYDWNFARAFRSGSLLPATSVKPGWQYAYNYPANCIAMREIARKRRTDPVIPYEVGLKPDQTGRAIFCDRSPVVIVYTAFVDDPNLYSDFFIEAAGWKLGSMVAGPLTKDMKRAKYCLDNFNAMLPEAKAQNANEGVTTLDDTDASWISCR